MDGIGGGVMSAEDILELIRKMAEEEFPFRRVA
jgi:hypothetical protein